MRGEPAVHGAVAAYPPVEAEVRYENGREHGGKDAQRQRDGKAAYRAGAELVEHGGGEQGGEIGIEDGASSFAEACGHGLAYGQAAAYLFAYALENKDVGVHRHTDGEHHARYARKGERSAEDAEAGKEQAYGEGEHEVGQQAAHAVADLHDEHDAHSAHHTGDEAGADGVGTKGRAYGAFFQHLDLGGKRAGAEHHGKVLRFFRGERAGDAGLAAADLLLDDGGALDDAVQNDGELLVDEFFGHAFELVRAPTAELDGDAGLVAFVEGGAGVHDVLPGEQGGFVQHEAAREVGAAARGRPVLLGIDVGIPCRAEGHDHAGFGVLAHAVEGELGRAADELEGALGVGNAGELYLDLVAALTADIGFGHAEGVDTAAQGAYGLIHDALAQFFFVGGVEGDVEFFPRSGRDGRTDCHLSEPVAQQVGELFDSLMFMRHEFQRSTVGMAEEAGPYSRIVSAGTDILTHKGQRLGHGLIDVGTEREMYAAAKIEPQMDGARQGFI